MSDINQIAPESAAERPAWLSETGHINELVFAEKFIEKHNLVRFGSLICGRNGVAHEIDLKAAILSVLKAGGITSNIAATVDKLHRAVQLCCQRYNPRSFSNYIPVKNGTLLYAPGEDPAYSTRAKEEFFFPCLHRFPVRYLPPEEYKEPVLFKQFISELFTEDDELTVLEYLAYCLVPYTNAQKMLVIRGSGGEGKSVLGTVMHAIMGGACKNGSLEKVEENRFARADLEDALLMIDDDMSLSALKSSQNIKTLITANAPLDLEKKGEQSYQAQVFCRFIGFTNGSLSALHDRSDGFYRRQIFINCKPRPKDRVDDPNLANKLLREKDAIFTFLYKEMLPLVPLNNYRFIIGAQTTVDMAEARLAEDSTLAFLQSDGYIRFKEGAATPSTALYNAYCRFCEDNLMRPLAAQSFCTELKERGMDYKITDSKHIKNCLGREVRGFIGVELNGQ